MKEINVYELKPNIKDGIMKTMYTMNGLLNEISFDMLSKDTIDMYLEGCLEMCGMRYKKFKRQKLYCGLLFDGKEFRGWMYNEDAKELENLLKTELVSFEKPKYWIGSV